MDMNPNGTEVVTNAGRRGIVTSYYEDWQAPGTIYVRLDDGQRGEVRWDHCEVVDV